ncbi:GIY-YIG nuclease family protein [Candidatus Dojkabacteria bacterium]|uniref:GIY-YIG nuclease family protein n=1 Tax=Candidatus Dojkabacteria bacterium TaxID=2099670 RepID=A0A955RJY4_9BACT|nr:GIY-YIG nuclease family protein [Candidatus Dojkabacteria bacterium]
MFFVYILYSVSIDRYYIGQTKDIPTRLEFHRLETTRYTSQTDDWELLYEESFLVRLLNPFLIKSSLW